MLRMHALAANVWSKIRGGSYDGETWEAEKCRIIEQIFSSLSMASMLHEGRLEKPFLTWCQ